MRQPALPAPSRPLLVAAARMLGLAVLLPASLMAGCSAPADASSSERAAVTATVHRYFKGHITGIGDHYKQAFHPEAKLFSVKDGKLAIVTRDEFAARATGKPAADEAKRVRRIVSVDIAGDAAMAKVELDYPDVRFVDYLSLLKLDGSWVIVNKIFHREAR
ncbi:MAG TPA: nuclear transport factor 2 family protein [Kofleriaceae bacterium]|nr:nuclear transport factor 2 family protein [Kofleriaceae bacterium]